MGKSQKRAQKPVPDDTGKSLGAQTAAAVRASAEGFAVDAEAVGCDEQVSPLEAAGYIHDMTIELKDIAESARLSFLSYLLDLVIEESAMQKRGRL